MRSRTGKIARLPCAVREELNRRITLQLVESAGRGIAALRQMSVKALEEHLRGEARLQAGEDGTGAVGGEPGGGETRITRIGRTGAGRPGTGPGGAGKPGQDSWLQALTGPVRPGQTMKFKK